MKIDIYGDNISYVTDDISTIPTNEANLNEENRIKFVTDLAAVSRGKSQSNNPNVRYKQLLKEAAPQPGSTKGKSSRPLEFCGIAIYILADYYKGEVIFTIWPADGTIPDEPLYEFKSLAEANKLLKYSYLEPAEKQNLFRCYTNMRALLNSGIPYDKIPYNSKEELKHFRAIKAKVPMFVWAQVPNTHTAISKEAQSDRVATEQDYWLPSDFFERIFTTLENTKGLNWKFIEYLKSLQELNSRKNVIKSLLENISQVKNQYLFKTLAYNKEIYQRAMYYFKYKTVVMTGWYNDPNVWKHLFIERSAEPDVWKNWTQKETKQFVQSIKKIIEGE